MLRTCPVDPVKSILPEVATKPLFVIELAATLKSPAVDIRPCSPMIVSADDTKFTSPLVRISP